MRWLAALVAMMLAVPASAQVVRIDTGVLMGTLTSPLVPGAPDDSRARSYAYLGIPFAAPPTGANRWRAPQPAAHWDGLRDASHFGADCQQDVVPNKGAIGPWTWEYLTQGPVSEDCLFINVWTPPPAAGFKLPVMLWLYGGGFTSGGTSVPLYDGTALAARGIIVVSVNYRVGIYGFLAHPELSKEAGSSGNYALLDQIAGLEWIKRNIAAFGGDPGKVTIAGQSAGAASVHALIASPKAKGLFHRAIAQSGSGAGLRWAGLSDNEAIGTKFGAAAGAASLADLRALSPAQISAAMKNVPGVRWGLTNGTPELPDGGKTVSLVPVLTGLTADEGSALSPEYQLTDAAGIRAALETRYGAFADRFVPLYPAPDAKQASESAKLMTRERGIASMLGWARARPAGAPPVYGYLWAWAEPGSKPQYRAFHSAELAYVFGTLAVTPERPFTERDHSIARITGDYWANFVKHGNPNGGSLPRWPAIDTGRIMLMGPTFAPTLPMRPEAQAVFDDFMATGGVVTQF